MGTHQHGRRYPGARCSANITRTPANVGPAGPACWCCHNDRLLFAWITAWVDGPRAALHTGHSRRVGFVYSGRRADHHQCTPTIPTSRRRTFWRLCASLAGCGSVICVWGSCLAAGGRAVGRSEYVDLYELAAIVAPGQELDGCARARIVAAVEAAGIEIDSWESLRETIASGRMHIALTGHAMDGMIEEGMWRQDRVRPSPPSTWSVRRLRNH